MTHRVPEPEELPNLQAPEPVAEEAREPEPTNTLAIASVIGAVVFAPAGIVLGHIALSRIKRSQGSGERIARAGMLLGYALTGIAVLVIAATLLFSTVFVRSTPDANEGSTPSTTPSSALDGPPSGAPLPPPEALTDVLYKLTDTSIPDDQKLPLIEGSTGDDAAKIDKFGKALADSGYTPVGFTAENIAWASSPPGNVTADVSVHSQAMTNGFTFPMEFKPTPDGGWQLSRTTANILLTLDQNPALPTQSPTQPPTPTPTG
jgi:hypothetical protein